MKTGIKALVIICCLSCLFIIACNRAAKGPQVKDLALDLQTSLENLDTSMVELLTSHAGKLNTEEEIRAFLDLGLQSSSDILTSCYIDSMGILKYLSPEKFRSAEGSDISAQDHIIALKNDPRPVFSKAFKAVEGFMTVVIAHPILNAEKRFAGAYIITLNPQKLANQILTKHQVLDDYELWAMQPDGLMVLNQDEEELGLNLFTDELYKNFESLTTLGKKIAAEPTGEGEYSFWASGTKNETKKAATWDTISLHGREWRVVLIKRI
ncbi:MAG: hypothetical protein PHI68_06890 [Candidatus Cloacimonetes bacterium]|nr:hypothetical protein [Candidatus Cloacimonadota bacterium]